MTRHRGKKAKSAIAIASEIAIAIKMAIKNKIEIKFEKTRTKENVSGAIPTTFVISVAPRKKERRRERSDEEEIATGRKEQRGERSNEEEGSTSRKE